MSDYIRGLLLGILLGVAVAMTVVSIWPTR